MTYFKCLLAAEHIPRDASSRVLVPSAPPLFKYLKLGSKAKQPLCISESLHTIFKFGSPLILDGIFLGNANSKPDKRIGSDQYP